MKVLIASLLAIAVSCLPCFAQGFIDTGVASITVSAPERVGKNEIFTAEVRATGVWGLAGFQMNVTYDKYVLHIEGVEEGSFLSSAGGTFWFVDDTDPGNIQGITCVRTGKAGVNGSGILFTMEFEARREGVSPITLVDVLVADPTGRVMHPVIESCVVKVTDYPNWDVNSDGITNVLDLILICVSFGQYISGNPETNPDVNRDGIVTVLDLILTAQHFGETTGSQAAPAAFVGSKLGILALRNGLAMIDGDTANEQQARAVIIAILNNSPTCKITTWAALKAR